MKNEELTKEIFVWLNPWRALHETLRALRLKKILAARVQAGNEHALQIYLPLADARWYEESQSHREK